jgi:hypothetical protein
LSAKKSALAPIDKENPALARKLVFSFTKRFFLARADLEGKREIASKK